MKKKVYIVITHLMTIIILFGCNSIKQTYSLSNTGDITTSQISLINEYIDTSGMGCNYIGEVIINDKGDLADIYNHYVTPQKENRSLAEFNTSVVKSVLSYIIPKEYIIKLEIERKSEYTKIQSAEWLDYSTYSVYELSGSNTYDSVTEDIKYTVLLDEKTQENKPPHLFIWKFVTINTMPATNVYIPSNEKCYLEFNEIGGIYE